MAGNVTIQEALQNAVIAYNLWAGTRPVEYRPIANGGQRSNYAELRGVFFNKLLSEIREIEVFKEVKHSRWNRYIVPENIKCSFTEKGYLVCVAFPSEYSSGYHELNRKMFIEKLCRASDMIRYYGGTVKKSPDMVDPLTAIVGQMQSYKV